MKYCNITIVRGGEVQTFRHRSGLGFQALCLKNKTPIQFDCRKADCGICIIRVRGSGLNIIGQKEKDFLQAMRADSDERLACQCRIIDDIEVEVEF